ncbi:MOSC domain-containing protein, partial [Lophiostoma macrostomum CBS 122681]
QQLWHYPVKGLGGIKLTSATIGHQGFEDDRTFCLEKIHRDSENNITTWETMYSGFHLQMVLFQCIIEGSSTDPSNSLITITRLGPENPNPAQLNYTKNSPHQIQFPLRPDVQALGLQKIHLDLHGSATDAYDMGPTISAWLSKYLGFETKLVYIGAHSRVVLGSGAPNGDMAFAKRAPLTSPLRRLLPPLLKTPTERITFQDIGQYLVVTRESNAQVSSRLEGVDMDIHKFRPNVIVSGAAEPYDEDYWAQLLFKSPGDGGGALKMEFGGTCWRCQAITADLKTGKKAEGEEGEVWKRLAKDRRVDKGWKYGPVFGKYGYTSARDVGRVVRVGDEAVLTRRVRERPIFDWPLSKEIVAAFSG